MKAIQFLPIAAVLLAGCATSPLPSEMASPVPKARLVAFQDANHGASRLVITRDKGVTGSGCRTNTFINGVHAAEIGAAESASFFLPPGRHFIGINTRGICSSGMKEAEISLVEDEEVRYRISIDNTGSLHLSPTAF
ncbi:hypothetical protein [Halomonas heilongjiangensis]|uniref:hypothetical protein n=1 Tax=Halomonas heilongjiangensis TaxID=1387883 RepID=UPI0011AF74FE|nr:hypothetical protein [Halomonas heilongjiangensis]